MFNILITAGGTIEKIDDVRSIINHSTGALGMEIAAAFLREGCNITCIVGASCVSPPDGATVIKITDVASLQTTLTNLLADPTQNFHAIIHAMAVSDYKVKNPLLFGKISSDADELTLTLQKTPKIISTLRTLAPNAVIVGFKLTSGLDEKDIISTGHRLLTTNNCDFVLANDTKNLSPEGHKGWLIQKDKSFTTHHGKKEIAENIARAVLEKLDSSLRSE